MVLIPSYPLSCTTLPVIFPMRRPTGRFQGGTVVGLLRNGLKNQAALQDRLCRPTVLTRRQPVKLERPPRSSRPLT